MLVGLLIGGSIGTVMAKRMEMTKMPEPESTSSACSRALRCSSKACTCSTWRSSAYTFTSDLSAFALLVALAFVIGVLIIIPIGGADMPVVADVDFAEIEQVRERLLMAQSVAALGALHEGLVDDALEADDSALAQGFPVWTGGPVSYAHFDGLGAFVAHAQILATQYGEAYVLPEAVIAHASQSNAYYLYKFRL